MTLEEEIQRANNKISSITKLLEDDCLRPSVVGDYKARLEYWHEELELALKEFTKNSKK